METDVPAGAGSDLFDASHDKVGDMVLDSADTDQVRKEILASCSKALTYYGRM